MIDKNTLARFILANDFSGDGLLTNEEFFTVESKFFNKDLSGLFDMPLWKMVDVISNTVLAEKVYTAIKNFDKNALEKLDAFGINLVANSHQNYPKRLIKKMKVDAPILLYCLGDETLLNKKSTAVIGARQIDESGKKFAFDIGESVAKEQKVLVSGGARGSDLEATKSAILNGGKAIWFVAVPVDEVVKNRMVKEWIETGKLLVCWDCNPFAPFSSKTALRRNKYIYANAENAFVCQVNSKISGTFSGANYCLKNKLCELFVFDNDSDAAKILIENGAIAIYKR